MTAVNALFPILFVLALGAYIKRTELVTDAFWPSLERLTYYILTPSLIMHGLASKSLSSIPWEDAVLVIYGTLSIAAAVLWLGWLISKRKSPERFTSVFQGGVRFNAFACLALVQGLYGDEGLIIGSLVAGFMIILVNLLCVSTFSVSLMRGQGNVVLTVIRQVVKNPLIIGCLAGLFINISGVPLPQAVNSTLMLLGKAALPTALLAVGAALDLSRLFHNRAISGWSGVVQFVLKPLCAFGGCYALGLQGITAAVVVVFLSSPTAPSAYILSRQLGGDHEIMAAIIAQQTVFAMLTIPVMIWLIEAYIPM